MAENVGNVAYGLDNLQMSVGAWVSAKGAGTLVDVGILEGGSEIDWSEESVDIFSDRHLAPISQEPIKRTCTLKTVMEEAITDNLSLALGAVASDKSGVSPTFTLEPGADNPAQYKQIQLVTRGAEAGVLKVATYTFWRCRRTGAVKLPNKKNEPVKWEVTWAVMGEITGTAPISFFKRVIS